MSVLLDTNLLTRSVQLNHAMRPIAEDAVAVLRGHGSDYVSYRKTFTSAGWFAPALLPKTARE